MKSKTTAAVLAFFLGSFGVHRFYLGQAGLGILYLVFCWTFIPTIIALIDFFGFLLMSEEAFNQKYNRAWVSSQSQPNNNVNTIAINMGHSAGDSASLSASDEIKKLYEMKEKGIITQEEFDLKKKTLL